MTSLSAILLGFGIVAAPIRQGPELEPVTQANWKLADKFTAEFIRQYTYSTSVTPGWIKESGKDTDRFWYRWQDSQGVKFYVVDCGSRRKRFLFDSNKMAALLSEVGKKPYDITTLPITTITFTEKADAIRFTVDQKNYEYNLEKETLAIRTTTAGEGDGTQPPPVAGGGRGGGRGGGQGGRGGQGGTASDGFRNYSPDRKAYVYAMDHNLYYVDVADEKNPIQLTKDGEKDYSFGSVEDRQRFQQFLQQQQQQQGGQTQQQTADPAEKRVRANVTWSKDSAMFYVTRSDSRKVKDLFLVNNLAQPRPALSTYKYAMPGEEDVAQSELFTFDKADKKLKKADVSKWKDQRLIGLSWEGDKDVLRFARRDRLQRNLEYCEFDPKSAKVKPFFSESVENANLEVQTPRTLKNGDIVWWSERTGWGHYYLYDHDGKLKNAITSGPARFDSIVELDEEKGVLWVRGVGQVEGENPYYRHLYRVEANGKGLTLLDPGNADHNSTLSPDKKYVVDNSSRVDLAPISILRDASGTPILELERADLSRLYETGWKMPETFVAKAADGVTDIYGNIWKPFDFNPKRKYPVIANVYPGPQTEGVSSTFSASAGPQRLAQLGFIVIQLGNRGGNPARSNAYQSFSYFNLRDYGLADKKAVIEQLASKNPWMDIERVGIYGHSGGGFMTAAALLLPPYNDFFKVGVSSSGNHDNNIYNDNWSEQYHGIKETKVPKKDKDGKIIPLETETKLEIKIPTTVELAANLKGKLLLATGDMDNNVHPANTIRLAEALIKANKRFDFILFPGQAHGYGTMSNYFNQMTMEFFAEHLLGYYSRGSSDMNEHKGKG